MECVHCGGNAFNRIVINEHSSEEEGGVCVDCEDRAFEGLIQDHGRHRSEGCALCPADADVSLPTVECLIEWDDGSVEVEYHVDEETLHLCKRHLEEFLDVETSATVRQIQGPA